MPPRFFALVLGMAVLTASDAARADEEPLPAGVVVAVGEVDGGAALAAARAAGGARWTLESLMPEDAPARTPPTELVEALRRHYLAADFLRCVTTLQDPSLSLDGLVEEGHLEVAAAVAVYGAACAHGAEDIDLARRLLEHLFVAALEPGEALSVTTPDFQQLAESVRRAVLARDRVTVEVRTRPGLARAMADGGARRCAPTPCPLSLIRGRHLITVQRLGYARRTVTAELAANGETSIALDPASADEVRAQLSQGLAGQLEPDDAPVPRAAADAFEARVAVVVWREEERTHALVYDRGRDDVLARVAAGGPDGARVAVRLAVEEWRGETEPTPLVEEPWFWIATVGTAAVAGVAVFLAVRPAERRYDAVFGR